MQTLHHTISGSIINRGLFRILKRMLNTISIVLLSFCSIISAYSQEKITINNHTAERVSITDVHAQYEAGLISPEGNVIDPFNSLKTELPKTYGYFTATLRDSNSKPICRVLTQQGTAEHGEAYAVQLHSKQCCHLHNHMRSTPTSKKIQYRTDADWTFDIQHHPASKLMLNKNGKYGATRNIHSQNQWNFACNDSPSETLSFRLDNQSSHRLKLKILEQHYLKLDELSQLEKNIYLQRSVQDVSLHPFQLFEPGYYSIDFGVFSIAEQDESEQFICQYIISHPGYENFVTEVSDGVMSYLYPGYTAPIVKSDSLECTIASTEKKNLYRMIIRDRSS